MPHYNPLSARRWKISDHYVLIVGTVTNVCCESSARDAMMLNFKTVMVSDGNSARSDAEHTATLAAFYAVFGDVMDTDMTIACLRKNAARVVAVADSSRVITSSRACIERTKAEDVPLPSCDVRHEGCWAKTPKRVNTRQAASSCESERVAVLSVERAHRGL